MDASMYSDVDKATGFVNVSFKGLKASVYDRATKSTKVILHDVAGECQAGRLLAIMGASGAGKSTLVSINLHELSKVHCDADCVVIVLNVFLISLRLKSRVAA